MTPSPAGFGWALAVALALAVGSTGDVMGQVCPEHAGESAFGGTNQAYMSDMVVRGQYAFGADSYGLGVWDVSDPSDPVHVSHWTGADLYGAAVALGPGNQVLLAHGAGLSILDLSDPCAPRGLGLVESRWLARAVAFEGQTAYVGYHAPVLQLIDISDPANPVIQGSYTDVDGSQISAIAVEDEVVYLLMASSLGSELQIIDVSDPGAPMLLGTYQTTPPVAALSVRAGVVYLGTFEEEFQIVDVSQASSPTLLSILPMPGERVADIEIAGDLAFVGVWGNPFEGSMTGLRIVDISDLANPTSVGEHLVYGSVAGFVALSGDVALVPTYDLDYRHYGFKTLDVSNPTVPERLGGYIGDGEATGIEISGATAVVANGKAGLEVFDITDPSALSSLGSLETGEFVGRVAVAGDIAYLAEEDAGLRLVDISEPRNPEPVSFIPMGGQVADVKVVDDVAYVANGYDGFRSFDVSDSLLPVRVGIARPPELRADGVDVSDGLAYVLYSCDLLRIYDISGRGNPVAVGDYEGGGCNRDISVSGSKAFVIDWSSLRIIDVSSPADPALLGSIVLNGSLEAVAISGEVAYVSAGSRGVFLVDVSDSSNPILVGTLKTSGDSFDAAVVGNTVFVAAEEYLEVFTTECRSPQPEITWESRGLEVDFSDASLFGTTSRLWDFGDGVTSVEQQPRHRYDAFGTYTVSLTVTNDFGSETETWVLTVPEGWNECRPVEAN